MQFKYYVQLIKKNNIWDIILKDRLKVISELVKLFVNIEDSEKLITITFSEFEKKTNLQLAYLHAEILVKLQIAYNEIGYPVWNEQSTKDLLKKHYGYIEEYYSINPITKEKEKETYLKSFSKAGKKELSKIIEYAIMICNEAGIEVINSEDFKNEKEYY